MEVRDEAEADRRRRAADGQVEHLLLPRPVTVPPAPQTDGELPGDAFRGEAQPRRDVGGGGEAGAGDVDVEEAERRGGVAREGAVDEGEGRGRSSGMVAQTRRQRRERAAVRAASRAQPTRRRMPWRSSSGSALMRSVGVAPSLWLRRRRRPSPESMQACAIQARRFGDLMVKSGVGFYLDFEFGHLGGPSDMMIT